MTETKDKTSATPFTWVREINTKKRDESLTEDDFENSYVPFLTNRALSFHTDSILFASELNRYPDLPKKMHFDFFMHVLDKSNRFSGSWPKPDVSDLADRLSETLDVNKHTASSYARILTKEQRARLVEIYSRGESENKK